MHMYRNKSGFYTYQFGHSSSGNPAGESADTRPLFGRGIVSVVKPENITSQP